MGSSLEDHVLVSLVKNGASQPWNKEPHSVIFVILTRGNQPLNNQGNCLLEHFVRTMQDNRRIGPSKKQPCVGGFVVTQKRASILQSPGNWFQRLTLNYGGPTTCSVAIGICSMFPLKSNAN